MVSIGIALQEARIQQGRTLQEVSDALNIKKEYLDALEKEEYDAIPGSVFVKGFIRNYGDYIGLDGQSLVREYKISYEQWRPQPEVRPVTIKKKKTKTKHKPRKHHGKWPEITIIAGVVIFLLLIIWIIW